MSDRDLNEESWNALPMPSKHAVLSYEGLFTDEQFQRIKRGLFPEAMEDRWYIYWEQPWLRFHRSWSGFEIYKVRFEYVNGGWRAIAAEINQDKAQHVATNLERESRLLDWIIRRLILHEEIAFPK